MIESSDVYTIAHIFSPSRLTIAREWRSLTKKELADKIGKTASAISQFESEDQRLRPDAQTVGLLSLALGLPAAFFAESDRASRPIPLEAGHFRSLRSASQRERRRLLATGALLCDLVSFLEEQIEFPPERVSATAQVAGEIDDVEACAANVRAALGLKGGPIPSVTKLLESVGAIVIPIDQASSRVDAFSLWYRQRPCVFLGVEKGSASRTQFDGAHELGHLIRHADVSPGDRDVERDADAFAAAFLLPAQSFAPLCPRRLDWNHFVELKRRWRVSLAALVRRARDLGCLSDASYRRANMLLRGRLRSLELETEPEPPTIRSLAAGLDAIRDEWSLDQVAGELRLGSANLRELLAGFEGSSACLAPHTVSS